MDYQSVKNELNQNVENRIVLAIGNVFEFSQRHNATLPEEELILLRQQKVNFSVSAETAVYWGGSINSRVVLLPERPHDLFMKAASELLNADIVCVVPKLVTGWVCRDLLADLSSCEDLLRALRGREVTVIPWAATEFYYILLDFLRSNGISIVASHSPAREDSWIVSYSDSKVGSRYIFESSFGFGTDFALPKGYYCHDVQEAENLAQTLYRKTERSLIVKSDRGDGGKSVILYDNSFRDHSHLVEKMQGDLWRDCGVVIEEAIGGGISLSTPSFDGFVAGESVTTLAIENMLTENRQCVGIEMGLNVLVPELYSRLESIGVAVGKHLASFGFRGWFDVDFLLPTASSKVYACEINPRRGGASASIEVANRALGPQWMSSYFVKSYERFWLNEPFPNFESFLFVLEGFLNKLNNDGALFILLSSRSVTLRKPYIGYIVCAGSREQVTGIERDLKSLLTTSKHGM